MDTKTLGLVRRVASLLALAAASACGGGPTVSKSTTLVPAGFDVVVSAGMPVSGAIVTVYAILDTTGDVNPAAGDHGVLGTGGPTDSGGHAAVTFAAKAYSGPVRVVASGQAMTYQDPTVATPEGRTPPGVLIPAGCDLSSFLPEYRIGAPAAVVPVTMLTTLADHEALAVLHGKHRSVARLGTLSAALAARDGLFVAHVTAIERSWSAKSLRTTVPAMLPSGTTSLVDTAYAALFDLALNQLARDLSVQAGYASDSSALSAPALLLMLEEDVDADGQLDGKGLGGRVITTLGATPVALDGQSLRIPLAQSLDRWVQTKALNRSGIGRSDLLGSQVYTSITLDASDLFADLPAGPFDPSDRAAPELALVGTAPKFTKDAAVALTLSASDASGVAAVHGQVGAQRFEGVEQPDGTWQLPVTLPSIGHNLLVVWGEDDNRPTANSGLGGNAPVQLQLDVVYDPTPPAIDYDAGYVSYQDERDLHLVTDGQGIAKMPAEYASGVRVAIPRGGDIYKASSRLSAGAGMTASELETTNARNIPVLRFVVPYDRNTDAPIQTPTFVARVSCAEPCPAYGDATGQLLPSAMPDDQRVLFDLPLAAETIPALANLLGPADVSITITVADGVGNTTTVPGFNFKFHTVGPPLALAEDTQYAAAASPESAFAYHLADSSYASMWTLGPQFDWSVVRLVRYFVTNPTPDPVAVQLGYAQDSRGSWQAVESWTRFTWAEPTGRNADGGIYLNRPDTSVTLPMDGFTFHNAMYWTVPYGATGGLAQAENGAHPCGSTTGGDVLHRMGDIVNKFVCSADTGVNLYSTTPEVGVFSRADASLLVFRVAPELQGQERDPERDPSGRWLLVPPATGGVPGTLVVYVARPVMAGRSRPLGWNAAVTPPATVDAVNHYQFWDYELFWGYHQPWSVLYPGYDTYVAYRAGAYLTAAQENLYGTLSATTRAYAGASLLGEPAPRLSVALAREPLVVH